MRGSVRRLLLICCVLIAGYGGYLYTIGEAELPPLRNGDIVFQTTWTNQSMAIALASGSVYIHTGLIELTPSGPIVIEAGQVVRETPLHQWISGGILKRFALYRYKNLTSSQEASLVKAARVYEGKPYDFYFSFDNDAIYCSELIYLAYRDSGLPLGKIEQIGSLSINNRFAKKLIEQRWRDYPKCKGKNYDFEQCYSVILAQTLVTPYGLTQDGHLQLLFTNYH